MGLMPPNKVNTLIARIDGRAGISPFERDIQRRLTGENAIRNTPQDEQFLRSLRARYNYGLQNPTWDGIGGLGPVDTAKMYVYSAVNKRDMQLDAQRTQQRARENPGDVGAALNLMLSRSFLG